MTIIEHLASAKAQGYEWADAAINNALNDDENPENADPVFDTLQNALYCAFFWNETEQGYCFWKDVHDKLSMDKRTVLQPIECSTKAEFDSAINNGNSVTNIVGWEGDPPAAGYYRQGGTFIWLFEQAEGTSIGFAVCA